MKIKRFHFAVGLILVQNLIVVSTWTEGLGVDPNLYGEIFTNEISSLWLISHYSCVGRS